MVEPFCGGLAVALSLRPKRALLNDANPHLVNFLKQLKEGLTIDIEMRNDKDLYYAHRKRFNDLVAGNSACATDTTAKPNPAADREAAALFYYLNRTCYNGLCRLNKKGQFNVPFGRYRTIRYRTGFDEYRGIMAEWEFICGDFEDMDVESDDFIYADPPYDVRFTQYSRGGFTWDDQVRLAKWLAGHKGPVIASNQATPRIVDLYSGLGFTLQEFSAPRMINCTGDRAAAKEILATKGV